MKVLAITTLLLTLLTLTHSLNCYYGREGFEEIREDNECKQCFTAEILIPKRGLFTYFGCDICEDVSIENGEVESCKNCDDKDLCNSVHSLQSTLWFGVAVLFTLFQLHQYF